MPRLILAALLAVLFLPGCNNTLNPFCGSARPVPMIGALAPSSVDFSQVQQGLTLTVKGAQFVAASQVEINGKPLATSVVSNAQLKVALTTGVISGPGAVSVIVHTPSGGSGDVGCSSGGDSAALTLMVN
jgi:hypothetical protein